MTKTASKATGLDRWTRQWEVQKAPYTKPLPFKFSRRVETLYPFAKHGGITGDQMSGLVTRTDTFQNQLLIAARNAALGRLVNKVNSGSTAALGISILQWRSSLDMITGALSALASKRQRARRYYSKKTGELYLEGIFGWLPMIQDIYSAIEVLRSNPPVSKVRGAGESSAGLMVGDVNLRAAVHYQMGCVCGADFKVSNLNLVLLNQLGLLNPASIAWDAVPYSFVLNWFIPVGQMLNHLTDFVGFEVSNSYTSQLTRKNASGSVRVLHPDSGKYVWMPRVVMTAACERSLVLPVYRLPSPQLPTVNLTKALIAMALFDGIRESSPPLRKKR